MLTGNIQFATVLLMLTERNTVAELKEHKLCPARMVDTVMPITRLTPVDLDCAPGGAFHPVNKIGTRVTVRDRVCRACGEGKGVIGTPHNLMLWRQKTLHGMPAVRDSRQGLTGDPWPGLVNTTKRWLHMGVTTIRREIHLKCLRWIISPLRFTNRVYN